jgi:hypothetical protein
VEVVPPWSSVGTWDSTGAYAEAAFAGASLKQLAKAITRYPEDWDALGVPQSAITAGLNVNVMPVIDRWEEHLRRLIRTAAQNPNLRDPRRKVTV